MLANQQVLTEQIAYYRARAGEYDQWFLRQGRYDRGSEINQRWHDQVQIVREALDLFRPTGDVLELACGTGLWTQQLAKHADHLTAVDASSECLDICRSRLVHPNLDYVEADLFNWSVPRRFDSVFFAFWLSHVPHEQFDSFWRLVRAALKPGGRVFFVDSLPHTESRAKDHAPADPAGTVQTRRLNDGREFRVVKIFYEPARLDERLREMGFTPVIQRTEEFFIYGSARETII
jgi:ubiquinone/menaquinone biosynthesis C-methylase UbiE